MDTYIINEWLPEDSSGVNGLQRQREALEVLTALAKPPYQTVVLEQSPFEQKFWRLCSSSSIAVGGIVRVYLLSLRQDSDRLRILKREEIAEVPHDLASATNSDDHYLLQTQLAVAGAILVTTDQPLREAVIAAGLPCLSREDFLAKIL